MLRYFYVLFSRFSFRFKRENGVIPAAVWEGCASSSSVFHHGSNPDTSDALVYTIFFEIPLWTPLSKVLLYVPDCSCTNSLKKTNKNHSTPWGNGSSCVLSKWGWNRRGNGLGLPRFLFQPMHSLTTEFTQQNNKLLFPSFRTARQFQIIEN